MEGTVSIRGGTMRQIRNVNLSRPVVLELVGGSKHIPIAAGSLTLTNRPGQP